MIQNLSTPDGASTLAVNFTQGLNDAWSKVAQFVPKLLGFIVVMVIGWFIAKMITKLLDRGLRKIGSEKLAERAGSAKMLEGSKYDTTAILCKVVYVALMLIVLQLGFGVFGPNPVSDMINGIVAWLPRGIVAVVLIVVAMAVANLVRDIVTNTLSSVSYGKTIGTIVWACIVVLGAIAALGQAGIATTVTQPVLIAALAAAAGILIVGVGGGLIGPMKQRWERWLNMAEEETAKAKGSARSGGAGAYQAGREDALTNQPVQERERFDNQ
ncbi:mechanosensitive ion channel family protein [Streptomyces sp. BH097]|uniref:mechanosensitive ion channel family protein n=1 Tax=unclassified Streptomyces TaxID=2593676 RepID=UPI003BB62512